MRPHSKQELCTQALLPSPPSFSPVGAGVVTATDPALESEEGLLPARTLLGVLTWAQGSLKIETLSCAPSFPCAWSGLSDGL